MNNLRKQKTSRRIALVLTLVFIFEILYAPLKYSIVFAESLNNSTTNSKNTSSLAQSTQQNYSQQTFNVFRYALFSGSTDTELKFSGSKMNITGDVHSNNSFVGHYSQLNISGSLETVKGITANGPKTTIGKKITNAKVLNMPDFYEDLVERYKDSASIYYGNTSFNSPKVSNDKPVIVHGDVTFNNAEVSGKGYILADNDIRFNVSKLKANNDSKVVYYSKNGNITINASNTQINGILYAPNGTVTFHGANLTVNGRIVAKNIVFNGSSITINSSPDDLKVINQAPIVEAGEPQEVELENGATLIGRVEDEGLINEHASVKWEKESGPGEVTFDPAMEEISNAKFSKAGEYVLKLSANDGQYTTSDTVKITVKEITKPNPSLNISGRKIQNRKITLDGSSSTSNPKYPLLTDKTEWDIVPVSDGLSKDDIKIDEDSSSDLTKNVIFKKPGDYKVTLKIANEKESATTEETITILSDEKPVADFKVDSTFYRDPSNDNKATIQLKDMSYSPDNDKITKRVWTVKYDSDNDGDFDDEDEETVDEDNNTEPVYKTSSVGKYKVELQVIEGFDDTITRFLSDDDYLSGDTSSKTEESKIFEVDNVKPEAHIEMQKSKNADIVFTVGKADFNKINDFSSKIESFKKLLLDKGINANVNTIATSSITASDSFAWDTYDHYNFSQMYGPTLPNHITIDGKDIKMVGYTEVAYKDFLFVPDDNKTQKTFTFDMKRDSTNWHSIEGGGFLFNSSIKDGKIQGFCILVTQEGIKLDQINSVSLTDFRNGRYQYVQNAGKLLKTYPIKNQYDNHNFKIVVDSNTVTLWDNGVLIIDNYQLPANDFGSGFGPITSHSSHACSQQSYFTFKNIVMQSVQGKSLNEVLNEQKWRSDAERFVINLSDEEVQDLKTSDQVSKVSETILQKGLYFGGLGTNTNESQYKSLINGIAGNGIYLNTSDFNLAMDNLENFVISKVVSKDYLIDTYINKGEEVSYLETYKDAENDPIVETKWKYSHEPNVFDNSDGAIESNDIFIDKPITIFDKVGAYGITLKVRDNPSGDNDSMDEYKKWSDAKELSKAIVVQRRPIAKIDVNSTLSSDKKTCYTTMKEEAYDLDHQTAEDKGIVTREYKWKKVSDETWTDGRLPGSLPVGEDYLVMMTVKDKEGTYSDPAVKLVSTKGLIQSTPEVDTEKPTLTLKLSKSEANIGDVIQVYVDAKDNIGIQNTEVYIDGKLAASALGARINFVANEVKTIEVVAKVTDPSGNETTAKAQCVVVDNRDKTAPVVQITTPKVNSLITAKTQIMGTVTDDKQLSNYKLQYRLKGTEDFTTIADGGEAKTNGVLGEFDPTNLANGTYEVRLTAVDAVGNSAYNQTAYIVDRTKLPGADTVKPTVEIALSKTTANVGDEVQATIKASDNVKVEKTSVYVDGNLVLESQGTVTFIASEAKIIKIEAVVVDSSGNETRQVAECSVVDNRDKVAPTANITSPVSGEKIDKPTEIIGTATDETKIERYKLQYRLKDTTDFITIVESQNPIDNGVLGTFDPTNLKNGIYEVRLTVEDKGGNNTYIQTTYVVEHASGGDTGNPTTDAEKPIINLVVSKSVANLNDVVEVGVQAKDNVAISKLELYIDGKLTEIKDGKASFTATELKTISIKAVAVDTSGNQSEETAQCKVIDKGDATTPTAEIKTPESDTHITAPTKIIGTAKDETKLSSYKLEYKLKDSKDFILFKEGKEPKDNEELGTFDPTMVKNGIYDVRLSVEDMGGNIKRTTTTYVVDGEMKIGHMAIGFQDINAMLSGINMSVDRQYDNGNKEKGDFGIGWTLGLNSMKVFVSTSLGDGWEQIQQGSMLSTQYFIQETTPHYIVVSYGNGKSDTFKMVLGTSSQRFMPIGSTTVNFECTTNPKVKLAVNGDNSVNILGGTGDIQLFSAESLFDDYIFNPQKFKLTTEDGTEVSLHVTNGVESIKDKNGNTLNVSKDGIKDASGKGIAFTRDSENRITSAKDPEGNTTSYEYDSAGDLVSVKNPADATVKFKYDSKHNIVEIIDPKGVAVARNEYDENGRLIATIDANGNRMEYSHDIEGRQEVVKDRLGNTTVFTYDDKGKVLSKTDALGNTESFTYDDKGNNLTYTDALKNTWSYKYDDKNNLVSTINSLGIEASAQYNTEGKISTIKDLEGNITNYVFDNLGRLKSVKDSKGVGIQNEYDEKGRLTGLTDQIGSKVQYTYDTNGNVSSKIDAAGNTTVYSYDSNGRNTSIKSTRTTNEGVKTVATSLEYDLLGNPVKAIDGEGNISRAEYNVNGKMSAYIDKLGNRTEFEYDNSGNIIKAKYPDGTTESFIYDAEGRNTEATNRDGIKIKYSYDKVGRITEIQKSDNNEFKYQYDEVGRVKNITDTNGAVTSYEYDALGRNTVIKDPYENKTTYEYDNNSKIISMVDAKNNKYEFKYDSYGNRNEIHYPDGTSSKSEYDAAGRLLKEIDQNENTTTYGYNPAGSLTSITNALGGKWTYKYDELNNLTEVTDPKNNTTKYEYDNNGKLIKTTLPLGMTSTTEYDAEGNVKKTTDFNGNSEEYKYDNQNRVIEKTNSNGDVDKYEYTSSGQIKSVTDKTGVTSFEYSTSNILKKKTTPEGTIFDYNYDQSSNLIEIKTQYGSTKYEYDLMRRLTKVTDNEGKVTEYKYDANGNRINKINSNGINTEYKYDQLNRLTEETVKDSSGKIIDGYKLTLGKTGNRTKVEEVNGSVNSYEYDSLYRLVKENLVDSQGSSKVIEYSYDAVGNRLTKTEDGSVLKYEYDSNNRLIKEGDFQYSYDKNGNTTSKKGPNKEINYFYDDNNKLIKVTDNDGNKVTTEEYKYDWQGNRIEKVTNGSDVTKYVVNTLGLAEVIAELDGNGALKTAYTYGDELISLQRATEKKIYIFDSFENVRMLTDESGQVTDTYLFDGFGNLLSKTGDTTNNYLYNGEQYDSNTGFYYLRARYMNPSTGRFVTMDPYAGSIFDPVSLHKYLYANANPIDNSDPTGYMTADYTVSGQMNNLSVMGIIAVSIATYDAVMMKLGQNLKFKATVYGMAGLLGEAVGFGVLNSEFVSDLLKLAEEEQIDTVEEQLIDYVENKIKDDDIKDYKDHSVYVLVDEDRNNSVVYVGRTINITRRAKQHKNDPEKKEYKMIVVKTGLTYRAARALEQSLISAYLKTEFAKLLNKRREIAKEKVQSYEEHVSIIKDLLIGIGENEILNLMDYGEFPMKK
ncbi:MAG: RHS repeat-associated core domain-containing protein [Clostridiaceae bacterium]